MAARACAALKHDHIVTFYQVGEDRGTPFLAMEFLEGMPLDRLIASDGKLTVPQILRIGREIAIELARRGARVAVHYRSSAIEAQEVAGESGSVFQADLTNTDAIERMFREIDQRCGRLDILVNSASAFSPASI